MRLQYVLFVLVLASGLFGRSAAAKDTPPLLMCPPPAEGEASAYGRVTVIDWAPARTAQEVRIKPGQQGEEKVDVFTADPRMQSLLAAALALRTDADVKAVYRKDGNLLTCATVVRMPKEPRTEKLYCVDALKYDAATRVATAMFSKPKKAALVGKTTAQQAQGLLETAMANEIGLDEDYLEISGGWLERIRVEPGNYCK